MMYDEAIWSSGKRIAAALNSLRKNIRREAVYRINKRTLLKKPPAHNLGGRVVEIGDREGELFSNNSCYFSIAGEGFGGKGDGLIGSGFGPFPLRDLIIPHRGEGLHVYEYDSKVWIDFCLLQSTILWRYRCQRWVRGEEERSTFLPMMSRLEISVRLGIMLGL